MKYLHIVLLALSIMGCKGSLEGNNEQQPLTTIEDALAYISDSFDNAEETLWISEDLLDPVGINMAIIGDGILKKGYMPSGFQQKEGYRIYTFTKE